MVDPITPGALMQLGLGFWSSKALLSAIEQNTLALYRYKAMKALKEMGGPDLLKKEEEEKAAAVRKAAGDALEDEGETTMEEGPPDDD